MSISTAGRAGPLLSLACAMPLLAACQTGPRQAVSPMVPPPVVVAQERGWLVARYVETGPGRTPYCIASRLAPSQELSFVATTSNTAAALGKLGVPLQPGAVYETSLAFDGGAAHGVQGKPAAGMLVVPLGGADVGAVLARFSAANSVTAAVPNIGMRKRFDLDGSTWAISKLSECIHGVPARIKAPSRPSRPADAKGTAKAPAPGNAAAAPAPIPTAPISTAPAPAAPGASGAEPKSGGMDLDLDVQQPVNLDDDAKP